VEGNKCDSFPADNYVLWNFFQKPASAVFEHIFDDDTWHPILDLIAKDQVLIL
jgi:hypothetical protein